MMEVNRLVQGFDERIVLSADRSCMRGLAGRMAGISLNRIFAR